MARSIGETSISWNANSESDLAGYKLYIGRASGTYTVSGSPVDVGNVTTTVYNVTATGAWFFAVTAYNTSAQESGFSSEITDTFIIPPLPVSQCGRGIFQTSYR